MSMPSTVCLPADIVYCLFLEFLVFLSRGNLDESVDINPEDGIKVLCFLSDSFSLANGGIPHPMVYSSIKLLRKRLLATFGIDSGVPELFLSRIQFDSLDDLMDFMESLSDLWSFPSDGNPNGATGPLIIGRDGFLGLGLRTVLVKWNGISFEQKGQLFEDLIKFTQDDASDDKSGGDMKAVGLSSSSSSCVSTPSVTELLDRAIQQRDSVASEDYLHILFDTTSANPIVPLASAHPASQLDNAGPSTIKRHQYAMLSLAQLWVNNGYTALADLALEEALKTAHQRDDHESISHALLLMSYVVAETRQIPNANSLIAAEDVLLKCLELCSVLGLDKLSSQASLMLAQLRVRSGLVDSSSFPKTRELADIRIAEVALLDDAHLPALRSTPQALHLLLLSSRLSSANLIHRVSCPPEASDKTRFNEINTPLTIETDEIVSSEEVQTHLSSSFIAAQLWSRLGVPSLGELECKRALAAINACKVSIKDWTDDNLQSYVSLCCYLATLHTTTLPDGSLLPIMMSRNKEQEEEEEGQEGNVNLDDEIITRFVESQTFLEEV